MKKNILLLSTLTLSNFFFAQVGVNTPNPMATFDIEAKNPTGTTRTVEGLLIPRVDRQRAQSMNGIATSTLIYVNNVTTGTKAGIAINIDNVGYYYFDGTNWVKLTLDISAFKDNDNNLYNSNGTLLDNRVVSQVDKTLAFNATSSNAFSINKTGTGAGTIFSADALNKRVGIGTGAPSGKFEIITDNEGGGAQNDFYFRGIGDSKYPGIFLTSSNGTAANQSNLATDEGIGRIAFIPRFNGTFAYTQGSSIYSNYRGNGTTGLTDLSFMTSAAERMKIDETGRVGIGISSPTNSLHINSSTAGAIRIVDGTQGVNRVLTSDANGVGIWKTLPTPITDTSIYANNGTILANRIVAQADKTLAFTGTAVNAFSVDGTTFSVDAANNRIGIGTNAPLSILSVVNPSAGNLVDAFSLGINNCGSNCGQGTARNITLFNANGTNSQFAGMDFIPATNAGGISGASIKGIDRDAANGYAGLQFYTRNSSGYAPRMTLKSSGNIGIGTTAPTNLFHIESATNGAVKIVDGTQGAGKVLTSSSDGTATWQTPNTDTNIYTNNGTILANRIVAQADKTLAFTSTATTGTSHFTVDGTTLNVNAVNHRVGLGTAIPLNPLDVRSTTAGAVRIIDGTQGMNKVFTSDASGVGTWQRASSSVVTGLISGGININFENSSTMRYTGNSITLPPGRWMVTVTQLIRINGPLTSGNGMFVRSSFSDETLQVGDSGNQSGDVIRPTLMSFMVTGNNGNGGGTSVNDVKTGNVYINNTSGQNKIYRYIVGETSTAGAPANTTTIIGFGGNWSENAIYATAVN